jgi:hypothetical protein
MTMLVAAALAIELGPIGLGEATMSYELPADRDLEALLRAPADAHDWELNDEQLQRAVAFLRSTRLAFDGRVRRPAPADGMMTSAARNHS